MKQTNPNSAWKRTGRFLISRWSREDYPGGDPCFKLPLFAKDVGIFAGLPLLAVILFHACNGGSKGPKRPLADQRKRAEPNRYDNSKSQILNFQNSGSGASRSGSTMRRAPGVLVRIKLQNVVATYSTAPVHAQITDAGLGNAFLGGSLIGDATPDSNFERINIAFKFAKQPGRENFAAPIAARALSLDGTLGLEAKKKEGFFTRSVFGSAGAASQSADKGTPTDFRDILLRALSAGFLQEFNSGTQVEKNRSQVLTLDPDTDFFAELTDFFPGGAK